MEQLSREQLKQILRALQNENKGNYEKVNEEDQLLDSSGNKVLERDGEVEMRDKKIVHGREKYLRQSSVKSYLAKLKPIRQRYTSSFTMHALDHIINGTFPEKVFWTVKLIVLIGTAIFMCRRFFADYYSHKVDTNLVYQPNTIMELPHVFICGSKMEEMLASQNNCASNSSKSYDEAICKSLEQKCPQFCKDSESDENCSDNLIKQGVTCDKRLLGQCVLLNADGKLMQTLNNPGMALKHRVDKLHFPLWVFVKPPGQIELMPTPGIEIKWTKINQAGNYHFSVEETSVKRLPYPYNEPKVCVKEGSETAKENNMFNGSYTMDKCLGTCFTRAQLKHCGSAFSITRVQAADQAALKKQLQDKTTKEIHDCHHDNINIYNDIVECAERCPTPCEEKLFSTSVRYEPSEKHKGHHDVNMFFYYLEMTEKKVDQSPSYVFPTLFANFGGTLGLMTGMSAISVIEMSFWFVMFLFDRCYRCSHRKKEI